MRGQDGGLCLQERRRKKENSENETLRKRGEGKN